MPAPEQHVTVTLAVPDILGLNTWPAVLVSAPGIGKMIVARRIVARLHFGTTPYVGNAGDLRLWYGGPVGSDMAQIGHVLTQNADALSIDGGNLDLWTSVAALDNQPLSLHTASAFTGGDGTLTIAIAYTVESIP